MDDPVPQVQDTFVEPVETDPTSQAADPPSPAKTADKPPSPAKAADDNTDDGMITGVGTPPLAILSLYQSIVTRKNFLLWTRPGGKQIYQAIPTSTPKTFILYS